VAARRAASKPKPIDLYYWPTPNGWKVSIMLEECRLAYRMIPVNIAKGEQFKPAFLKISPNNRIPAIVDCDGPGGAPISVFESGAILQYLGRKTGRFYPASERARVEVDQWLFWQMANLGPKSGEANHFATYAAVENQRYAIERFTNERHRLFGVMNERLKGRAYLAGRYSIADMACVGWVRHAERRPGLAGVSVSQAMARESARASGGAAWHTSADRGGQPGRCAGSRRACRAVREARALVRDRSNGKLNRSGSRFHSCRRGRNSPGS
jgi:glutathione S-transferase